MHTWRSQPFPLSKGKGLGWGPRPVHRIAATLVGFSALVVALGLALPPPRALAQGVDPQALYDAAKADLVAGQPRASLDKLARALAQPVPDEELLWSLRLAQVLAWQGLDRPLDTLAAIQRFHHALDASERELDPAWQTRREAMQQKRAELEAQVLATHGVVEVQSTPGGARILVDGQPLDQGGPLTTPFRVYLKPGTRRLRVELEGYLAYDKIEYVGAGKSGALHATLELLPTTGTLVVVTGAVDARVRVNGDTLGAGAEVRAEVGAGPRLVQVERPGFEAWEAPVTLNPGATVTLNPVWIPRTEQPAAPLAVVDQSRPAGRSAWLEPLWGWIMLGSGVALAGVGIPFTIMAKSDYDELTTFATLKDTTENIERYNSLLSSKDKNQAVAGVMYGLGGAAIVGGAVWLTLAYVLPQKDDDTTSHATPLVHVAPWRDGAALSLGWRW